MKLRDTWRPAFEDQSGIREQQMWIPARAHHAESVDLLGGDERIRTADLLSAIQMFRSLGLIWQGSAGYLLMNELLMLSYGAGSRPKPGGSPSFLTSAAGSSKRGIVVGAGVRARHPR